jgi:dinuclear metal center YbgI/SA1388 family protein
MIIADLVRAMEEIAPTRFSAEWDNVGLLVGDPDGSLTRVLLAVDCTRAVLEEAIAQKCEAIVAYHPPIFAPQKRCVAGSIAYAAVRAGVAIYAVHTALDVAEGGTNDVLADALGMLERQALRPVEPDRELKLVTFVPAARVTDVSEALFAAGAGVIGRYSSCSFRSPGTGTFFGEQGTNPAVGLAGRLEEAPEVRVEMVVPAARAAAVVRALRSAHPYEEPAIDLIPLEAAPVDGGSRAVRRGFGRIGAVPPEPASAVLDRVKRALGVKHALAAGALDRVVARVAVCAGSGGDFVPDAIAARADLLLTGELRHHDVLRAREAGLVVLCTLHSVSERPALAGLGQRLIARLAGVEVAASHADREPLEVL